MKQVIRTSGLLSPNAGLRDVLIHEYFGVSLKTVWRIVKIDLLDLKSKISRIWEETKNVGS
jgi:uncharacterized protein with HEPN domain